MAASQFTNLVFWINGGSGGQIVQVQATSNGVPQTAVVLAALPVSYTHLDVYKRQRL